WAASVFARRLARILVFGDRRFSVTILYIRYFEQAVGRRLAWYLEACVHSAWLGLHAVFGLGRVVRRTSEFVEPR
ncbi:hypothetical protein P0D89_54405, partial [Paraburkholderia sp. RL18-085-BIA-A]